MRRLRFHIFTFACTSLLAATAATQTFDVKTTTLKNGMKVLVQWTNKSNEFLETKVTRCMMVQLQEE
jgi:hypothetical protein